MVDDSLVGGSHEGLGVVVMNAEIAAAVDVDRTPPERGVTVGMATPDPLVRAAAAAAALPCQTLLDLLLIHTARIRLQRKSDSDKGVPAVALGHCPCRSVPDTCTRTAFPAFCKPILPHDDAFVKPLRFHPHCCRSQPAQDRLPIS